MNCPACEVGQSHPTNFNDLIVCIGCKKTALARHNHVMCIECEEDGKKKP